MDWTSSPFFLTLIPFILLPIVPPKVVAIGSYRNNDISKSALNQFGTSLKLDRTSEKESCRQLPGWSQLVSTEFFLS